MPQNQLRNSIVASPLGNVKITTNDSAVCRLVFTDETELTDNQEFTALEKLVTTQLEEYFRGERQNFELVLKPEGTEFQQAVWKQLQLIPYGKTITYSQLSVQLGDIRKIRAVANANGKNPIWILIPCHRVIGKGGEMRGYAGGIERKRLLLELEDKKSNRLL